MRGDQPQVAVVLLASPPCERDDRLARPRHSNTSLAELAASMLQFTPEVARKDWYVPSILRIERD